ncbi:MAG: nuclear transport factor 2 family protein [Myxococcota bacterium]
MLVLLTSAALAGPAFDDPKEAVRAFVDAADAQDTAKLEKALHPEFRVVAQMPDGVSVLSRETYVGLVGAKKIGGTPRKQAYDAVVRTGDLATVKGTLDSEAAHFDSTWTVVRTDAGWQVVQDATVFEPKK